MSFDLLLSSVFVLVALFFVGKRLRDEWSDSDSGSACGNCSVGCQSSPDKGFPV